MTSIGGNLNGTDATNFYNAMLTYMIAVGVADSDADVTRWMVQARSNGGSVSIARRNVVHNLITSLKADGIWTKLDRLWLFAAENTGSALTDIVAGGLATAVNTPTFAADLGYTGNASNMQIDSNFDPSSGSPQYVRDSACLFAWDNTGTSQTGAIVGRDGGANTRIIPISGANTFFAINQSQQITALGLGSYTGLWVANRTGANAATLDRNGTQVDTTASGSVGGITGDLTGLSDGASVYSDHQVCCMGMGSQLSGGERANLYTHLRTYMTAVGVP